MYKGEGNSVGLSQRFQLGGFILNSDDETRSFLSVTISSLRQEWRVVHTVDYHIED
jgi:hypothetical protein